jgi:integrase
MRKGEISNLRLRDIGLANKFIHVETSKSGKRRDIPMNNFLTETVRFDIKKPGSEYVFCNDNGKPFIHVDRSFKTALKRAGIRNFRFQDLRHTFASYLAMAGVSIYTISKLLGHTSVRVTERYAHLSPKDTAAAVDLLPGHLAKANDTLMTLEPKIRLGQERKN